MYQNDNKTFSLTPEVEAQYIALRNVKPESIFDGTEVSPLSAAINQLVGLYAVCFAATFIATIILGKVA